MANFTRLCSNHYACERSLSLEKSWLSQSFYLTHSRCLFKNRPEDFDNFVQYCWLQNSRYLFKQEVQFTSNRFIRHLYHSYGNQFHLLMEENSMRDLWKTATASDFCRFRYFSSMTLFCIAVNMGISDDYLFLFFSLSFPLSIQSNHPLSIFLCL